jgi:hypothetical protein
LTFPNQRRIWTMQDGDQNPAVDVNGRRCSHDPVLDSSLSDSSELRSPVADPYRVITRWREVAHAGRKCRSSYKKNAKRE